MRKLGIRHGPGPTNDTTFNEADANPYTSTMPDVLTMKDGTKITWPDHWPASRQ